MEILENILPKVGDKLGSFELVNELGRGGFGLVFLARHLRLNDDFALKLLLPNVLSLDQLKKHAQRFTRW